MKERKYDGHHKAAIQDAIAGANEVGLSSSNALLSDLRAAVSLAAGMLERDGRPVRTDAAKELREKFGALSESLL